MKKSIDKLCNELKDENRVKSEHYIISNWYSSHISSVQSLSFVWLFATHGLQHTRLPCPSPSPRACSDSCRLSRHPTISSSVIPFSSCLQSFPASESFPRSQFFASILWWPKYWSFSFSISLSNEYSGLISFTIDWFDLLVVQGTLKSLLHHHSSKASFNLVYSRNEDLWTEIINLEK